MFRASLVSVYCFLGISAFIVALPANAQDKIWRKYDLQSVVIPPSNVVYGNTPVRDMTIEEFTQPPAQRAMRGIKGIRTTITTPKSISVHAAPDIQQRIAENIAHLQRAETKNAQFVMEISYLTLGDVYEHQFGSHNPENVIWKNSQYGLIAVGTGRGHPLPPKIGSETSIDIESPVRPYWHPISGLKEKTTRSGVQVYRIAKDDIPKMQEDWNQYVHNFKKDSRFRSHFQSQHVVTSNGQLGINRENVFSPLTLSEKKWYQSSPTHKDIIADMTFASVSFISVDDRTVSSDIDIRFPQFPKFSSIQFFTLISIGQDHSKDSAMDYLTISEENLNWSVDGMLVVLMNGIPLMSDGEIVKKESGVPILNRKQVYSLTEHEIQALIGILTIKMISPSEAR